MSPSPRPTAVASATAATATVTVTGSVIIPVTTRLPRASQRPRELIVMRRSQEIPMLVDEIIRRNAFTEYEEGQFLDSYYMEELESLHIPERVNIFDRLKLLTLYHEKKMVDTFLEAIFVGVIVPLPSDYGNMCWENYKETVDWDEIIRIAEEDADEDDDMLINHQFELQM